MTTYYQICNRATGKCLDADLNEITKNGAVVHQWSYSGGAHQQWERVKLPNGYYKIVNRASGKCLDIEFPKIEQDGAMAQQWDYNGTGNQEWEIEDLDEGYSKIVCQASNKWLTGELQEADGGDVIQAAYQSLPRQEWKLIKV